MSSRGFLGYRIRSSLKGEVHYVVGPYTDWTWVKDPPRPITSRKMIQLRIEMENYHNVIEGFCLWHPNHLVIVRVYKKRRR